MPSCQAATDTLISKGHSGAGSSVVEQRTFNLAPAITTGDITNKMVTAPLLQMGCFVPEPMSDWVGQSLRTGEDPAPRADHPKSRTASDAASSPRSVHLAHADESPLLLVGQCHALLHNVIFSLNNYGVSLSWNNDRRSKSVLVKWNIMKPLNNDGRDPLR